MNKLLLFFFGLFLFGTSYAYQGVFCSKAGRSTLTIGLHENGTAEWTKRTYGHGDAPCGIDPAWPTYQKGSYSVDQVKQTILINYPGRSVDDPDYPKNLEGNYSVANDQIQKLDLKGESGGTFDRTP